MIPRSTPALKRGQGLRSPLQQGSGTPGLCCGGSAPAGAGAGLGTEQPARCFLASLPVCLRGRNFISPGRQRLLPPRFLRGAELSASCPGGTARASPAAGACRGEFGERSCSGRALHQHAELSGFPRASRALPIPSESHPEGERAGFPVSPMCTAWQNGEGLGLREPWEGLATGQRPWVWEIGMRVPVALLMRSGEAGVPFVLQGT